MSILIKYIKVKIYYKYYFSVEVKLVNSISTFAIPANILRIKESNWIIEQKKKGKKENIFFKFKANESSTTTVKNLKKRKICLKYSRFLCVYGIMESEKV